jgi:hypothetical protein
MICVNKIEREMCKWAKWVIMRNQPLSSIVVNPLAVRGLNTGLL